MIISSNAATDFGVLMITGAVEGTAVAWGGGTGVGSAEADARDAAFWTCVPTPG